MQRFFAETTGERILYLIECAMSGKQNMVMNAKGFQYFFFYIHSIALVRV